MARFSRIGGLVTAAGLLLLVAGPVKAAAVSQIYNVTASGFGTGAPVDPVTGLFNVIFDNLSNIADTALGISVISLGIAVDGAVGFSYSVSDDALSIGGIQGGVGGITPNTNDFS